MDFSLLFYVEPSGDSMFAVNIWFELFVCYLCWNSLEMNYKRVSWTAVRFLIHLSFREDVTLVPNFYTFVRCTVKMALNCFSLEFEWENTPRNTLHLSTFEIGLSLCHQKHQNSDYRKKRQDILCHLMTLLWNLSINIKWRFIMVATMYDWECTVELRY